MKGHNSKRRYYAARMRADVLKSRGQRTRAVQGVEMPKKGERVKDTSNIPDTGNGLTRNERMARDARS